MAAYRGLSVRLLLEELRSQSCKREVHEGVLENLIFVCVHTTEWFAIKFRVFVRPGLLCTEWRFGVFEVLYVLGPLAGEKKCFP